jgi:hypothetical protein
VLHVTALISAPRWRTARRQCRVGEYSSLLAVCSRMFCFTPLTNVFISEIIILG